MVKTTELQSFLKSLQQQGKMPVSLTGDKMVDRDAFARVCAEILIDRHMNWVNDLYGYNGAPDLFARRPAVITSLTDRLREFMYAPDYVDKNGRFLVRFEKAWNINNSRHKLPIELFGMVGGTMKNFVHQARDYVIDFTDKIDWEDGQFGKSGSCWWHSYIDSIPTFQHAGGWAIRFYSHMGDHVGIGRTWILPKYQSLLFFNTYGTDVSDVKSVMLKMLQPTGLDWKFRKIEMINERSREIPYINTGSGFLITTSDNAKLLSPSKEYINVSLEVKHAIKCINCDNAIINTDDMLEIANGNVVCHHCYERTLECDGCGHRHMRSDLTVTNDTGHRFCNRCIDSHKAFCCRRCGGWFEEHSKHKSYCKRCYAIAQKSIEVSVREVTKSSKKLSDTIQSAALSAEDMRNRYINDVDVSNIGDYIWTEAYSRTYRDPRETNE